MNSKIVLVGRDTAPARCFAGLAPLLEGLGYEVELIASDGKPIERSLEDIRSAAASASLVLVGISSSEELVRAEVAAAEAARDAGVPYGFYGDVAGKWKHFLSGPGGWFVGLGERAAFYCGVSRFDADHAKEAFPNALVFGTGNPLREEMAFPKYTSEEVRRLLGLPLPTDEDALVVLAPGHKFPAGNIYTWSMLMDALDWLAEHKESCQPWLVIAPHPGDSMLRAIDAGTSEPADFYEELASFAPIPTKVVMKDTMNAADIIPAADIVVGYGGSISIGAAYQRIPSLFLDSSMLSVRRVRRGLDLPEPVRAGFCAHVLSEGPKQVAEAIADLLTDEGMYSTIRKQQELCCPVPEREGEAAQRIVEVLKNFL